MSGLDSVRKGIPLVLTTGLILVNEHNDPLLILQRTDSRKPHVFRAPREVSLSGLNGDKTI